MPSSDHLHWVRIDGTWHRCAQDPDRHDDPTVWDNTGRLDVAPRDPDTWDWPALAAWAAYGLALIMLTAALLL